MAGQGVTRFMTERTIDPERARKPAFDNDRGFSGQDYDLSEERKLAAEATKVM